MPTPNDRPLLLWVRLHDGRLWHLDTGLFETECGRSVDPGNPDYRTPEYLADAPPTNGWVCDRCVRAIAEQASAARQSWLQDPRRRPGDQLPGPDPDSPPDGEIRADVVAAAGRLILEEMSAFEPLDTEALSTALGNIIEQRNPDNDEGEEDGH